MGNIFSVGCTLITNVFIHHALNARLVSAIINNVLLLIIITNDPAGIPNAYGLQLEFRPPVSAIINNVLLLIIITNDPAGIPNAYGLQLEFRPPMAYSLTAYRAYVLTVDWAGNPCTRVPCNCSLRVVGPELTSAICGGGAFPYFGVICLTADQIDKRKEGSLIYPKSKKPFSI